MTAAPRGSCPSARPCAGCCGRSTCCTGLLTATAVYLGGVTAAEWATGASYQGYVYQWTVLVASGASASWSCSPFVVFAPAHALAARTAPQPPGRTNRLRAGSARGRRARDRAWPDARGRHRPAATRCACARLLAARAGAGRRRVGVHAAIGGAAAPLARARGVGAGRWPRGAGRADRGRSTCAPSRAPVVARRPSSFEPSLARTATGHFIPARTLMMDDYCLECHDDAYQGWFSSAHRFSSFNNPAYLFSVSETREVVLAARRQRRGRRWCAGCHDLVPFFSGAFDDPELRRRAASRRRRPASPARSATRSRTSTARGATPTTRSKSRCTIRSPTATTPSCSGSTSSWSRPSRSSTRRRSSSRSPDGGVLLDLPQGAAPAERSTTTRSSCAGRTTTTRFLLSGVSGHGARSFYYPPKAEAELRRLPHAARGRRGDFGAQHVRRQRRAAASTTTCSRRPTPASPTCAATPRRSCRRSRTSSTRT